MAAEYEDIDNQTLIVTGVVSAVVVFIIVIALQAGYYHAETEQLNAKVVSQVPEQLQQLVVEQQGQLHSFHWVDQKNGVVAIPIERAMELVVQEAPQGAPKAEAGKK